MRMQNNDKKPNFIPVLDYQDPTKGGGVNG